jgi:hypothetical protein
MKKRFGKVLFVIHTRDRPYAGDATAVRREQDVLFAVRQCWFIV